MKKRALSLLLCLVFLVGLMPTTALAAGGATDTWDVDLVVSKNTAVQYNGQDTVEIGFGVQSDNLKVKSVASIFFAFDMDVFEFIARDPSDSSGNTYFSYESSDYQDTLSSELTDFTYQLYSTGSGKSYLKWSAKAYIAKKGTTGYFLFQPNCGKETACTDKIILASVLFALKPGKTFDDISSTSIRLATKDEVAQYNQTAAVEITNGDGISKYAILKDGTTDTLNKTPAVVWNGISPSKPAKPDYTGAIAAPTVNSNAGGKVELNAVTPSGGPGGETVQYGYSKTNDGKNITWQNSTTFNLTVGSTYYFYAKVVESATYKEKVSAASAAVPVADKALTSISISGDATAAVPTKGSTTTVNLTATGKYDDSTTGDITAAAAWTVDPAYTGVSVSKGVVTIAPEAAAGKVTIKAEKDSQSKTHSITLSKASAELKSMTISGADGVAVPPVTSSPKEVTYTVSGEDQFGAPYTPTAVSWSIDDTAHTGVSIGSTDGKLSVPSTAKTGSVTIKATSGSINATKAVSITKADPAVDTVTIGGGVTTLAVPAMDTLGTEKKVAATAAFTATLKDQYGADISSGTVTWSVSGNSGVIIDLNTGLLTISSSATDVDVTVTATAENGKTGTASVTINKATSAATFVQVKKGGTVVTTDSIVIPTSGSPATTVTYTAEVYDQYGALYTSDTPTWSITSATGVSVSAGTVSVDNTASAGTSVTLTATSSTNPSKTAAVTLTLTDKDSPTVSANDITTTYDGNAIPDSKITGTATFGGTSVPGTWAWKTGMAVTNVADTGTKTVTFNPTDSAAYESVDTNITVTINKATPTGEPTYTKITTGGKKLSDAALAIGSITPAGGSIAWDLGDTTEVTANTAYNWTYTLADTNYDKLTGTITPYVVSYSGGGSYTPTYAITVDKTANGTVTVTPGTAKTGDTVTLTATPDKGYELDTIKALDKDGKELKLTDQGNGKYTFTMPAGKVTVKAAFEDSNLVKFDDVSKGDYCYEAVKWAVKNGITSGIGNNRFGPNDPCTRAQIVTFLWRAAGSPEPKSMSSFSDVPADSYYAKAVAWAVEKGITSGTGDGKFSPEDPCTRAQSVTFLYRAAGSPAVIGSAEFSDVASDTYYAAAVAWAAKNGITSGTGGGQFGSDDECSRGHIVTFLFNAYGK